MKAFLATVLSVIAAGVLLIAYAVLTQRGPTAGFPDARPIVASQRLGLVDDGYAAPQTAAYGYAVRPAVAYPVNDLRMLPDSDVYARPRPLASNDVVTRAPRRTNTAVVERASGRSWQKTAMVIGGSSAAGAGLGAIFGGKKGALIGAAIGGGAGTLFEVNKRP
ncbi:MAG TPA: hypothetical protein VKE96_05240 [Vicinamibacterales bacterium]|nr:hypothetical protein [Vicinamibacterales bacterium]